MVKGLDAKGGGIPNIHSWHFINSRFQIPCSPSLFTLLDILLCQPTCLGLCLLLCLSLLPRQAIRHRTVCFIYLTLLSLCLFLPSLLIFLSYFNQTSQAKPRQAKPSQQSPRPALLPYPLPRPSFTAPPPFPPPPPSTRLVDTPVSLPICTFNQVQSV